ncbi:MAG: hypothetical protein NTX30_02190, partial [Deltaproteobacteria bacterium]|nr:hypothetical protein [Deltaproteobacteria bacterium]
PHPDAEEPIVASSWPGHSCSCQPPPEQEDGFYRVRLMKLPLDALDEFVTLAVDGDIFGQCR